MCFGFWISFFDEMFLFILVCAGINLRYNFEWKTSGDAINTISSLLISLPPMLYPFFLAVFYTTYKNQQRILKCDQDFIKRYGSFIKDLNFRRRGKRALWYPCAQQLRKLWLAGILILGNDYPVVLNLFCVVAQSLIMFAVIGYYKPYISTGANRMLFFNEILILMFTYCLFPLTSYSNDPEVRDFCGKGMISVVKVCCIANCCYYIFQGLTAWVTRLKLFHQRGQNYRLQRRRL